MFTRMKMEIETHHFFYSILFHFEFELNATFEDLFINQDIDKPAYVCAQTLVWSGKRARIVANRFCRVLHNL